MNSWRYCIPWMVRGRRDKLGNYRCARARARERHKTRERRRRRVFSHFTRRTNIFRWNTEHAQWQQMHVWNTRNWHISFATRARLVPISPPRGDLPLESQVHPFRMSNFIYFHNGVRFIEGTPLLARLFFIFRVAWHYISASFRGSILR